MLLCLQVEILGKGMNLFGDMRASCCHWKHIGSMQWEQHYKKQGTVQRRRHWVWEDPIITLHSEACSNGFEGSNKTTRYLPWSPSDMQIFLAVNCWDTTDSGTKSMLEIFLLVETSHIWSLLFACMTNNCSDLADCTTETSVTGDWEGALQIKRIHVQPNFSCQSKQVHTTTKHRLQKSLNEFCTNCLSILHP